MTGGRRGRREHNMMSHVVAHPGQATRPGAIALVLVLCIGAMAAVLAGEVWLEGNITFDGFVLLTVIASLWLLPLRYGAVVSATALILPSAAYAWGAVPAVTAKFQFMATVTTVIIVVFTIRSIQRVEEEQAGAEAALIQFTADAAHELRSPLTIMSGVVELTLNQPRSEAHYVTSLQTVQREVQRLVRVSDSLLLLARNDAGELALRQEDLDIADLLEEVLGRWSRAASTRHVALTVDSPVAGPIHGDAALLGRLLDNLVDNALRHTPENGAVTLTVRLVGGEWEIAVSDTGSGIPAGMRRRVFERFGRADEGRDRDRGGAGLGLPLARAIAQGHGGSLQLSTANVAGTRMIVRLPVASTSAGVHVR